MIQRLFQSMHHALLCTAQRSSAHGRRDSGWSRASSRPLVSLHPSVGTTPELPGELINIDSSTGEELERKLI